MCCLKEVEENAIRLQTMYDVTSEDYCLYTRVKNFCCIQRKTE